MCAVASSGICFIYFSRFFFFFFKQKTAYEILHSHYWLSGVAAMQLARRWDVPHITMFHTLGRLKQLANPNEIEPSIRLEMERRLIEGSISFGLASSFKRPSV